MGFAEAPHGQSNGEKNGNHQAATIAFSDFQLPFLTMLYSPKKGEGNFGFIFVFVVPRS